MQILRNIVSDIAGDIRAITHDDRYSYRFLANKFLDKIQYFLRQDAKSREVFRDMSMWETINCIKLEDITGCKDCGITIVCNTLKKSKDKMPQSYDTSYGKLIKVITIDGSREFTQISSFSYKDYTNKQYGAKNQGYYWIENGYLYVPDTEIDTIRVMIVPKNSNDVAFLNGECIDCVSPLDAKINYPDYLITLAKQETVKEIAGIDKRIVQDEKGDLNTNIKN